MSTNNIDEIFRRGMDNQTPDVPENVWDEVSNRIHKHTLRRNILFAAAASVALLLSVGVAFLSNSDKPAEQVASKAADTTEAPAMHKAEIIETPNYADSATYIKE